MIVKNDIILKMTPENRRKTFHNQTKLDCRLSTQRNHWINTTRCSGLSKHCLPHS